MCHLINTIVDSEDTVEIEDKKLELPQNITLKQGGTHESPHLKNQDEQTILNQLFNKFKNDENRIN